MTITIEIPNYEDLDILKNIDSDVFDNAIDLPRAIEVYTESVGINQWTKIVLKIKSHPLVA